MKQLFAVSLLLLTVTFAHAQSNVFLADKVTGNLYKPEGANDIEGSRYFLEDWVPGIIYMKDGYKAEKFVLKFDLSSNELLFQHDGQTLVVVNPVKEFVLTANFGSRSFLFRKGYAPIDRNDGDTYYQVLRDGSVNLLKHTSKMITERKEYGKAGVIKEYATVINYYIARADGSLVKIKKNDRSSLLGAIGDSDGKLAAWAEKKKNRVKSEEDMVELVKAFNEGLHR